MEEDNKLESIRKGNIQKANLGHYYGDTVRSMYIGMAVLMLVATPFIKTELPFPAFISILAVLVLSILAGFTNPTSKAVMTADFIISVVALLFFGREMILAYNEPHTKLFFSVNLALSVISVFSLYFSTKTLRGSLIS